MKLSKEKLNKAVGMDDGPGHRCTASQLTCPARYIAALMGRPWS
jgi:hypothetical protein